MEQSKYLCIDLKSFYASVECAERGLDPFTTNLVVADPERSEKTICLAVTPALKALGVKNRCRVFEIPRHIPYIMAEPRMKLYIDYAAEIYALYLRYFAPEDIHVYSIDEVFIDITGYLALYRMTAREMAQKLMEEIFAELGIRAACGIGTNLYLAKVALDITAKSAADFTGELDEETYCHTLWEHRPLTDFWRVGRGTARRLEQYGITTMKQIACCDEDLLYKIFGIDAELLRDHAWGRESTTMRDIKNYKAKTNCLTSGQVLMRDYTFDEGKIIVREMLDLMCLELTEKQLQTASVTFYIGYSNEYALPSAKGTVKLLSKTNSAEFISAEVIKLYEKTVKKDCAIKRVNIAFNNVTPAAYRQDSLFADEAKQEAKQEKVQQTVLAVKQKYGKNALLKGLNFQQGATTRERNRQIGGHKSGE